MADWEEYGCEGANEYKDCELMSADYARLCRMERRVKALIANLRKSDDRAWVSTVAEEFEDALAEPEADG